jgi:hypothetical protein
MESFMLQNMGELERLSNSTNSTSFFQTLEGSKDYYRMLEGLAAGDLESYGNASAARMSAVAPAIKALRDSQGLP